MQAKVQDWLEKDPDLNTKEELLTLIRQGNTAEIEQRFHSRLKFGTAGLRGIVGAGPARMNRLVIRQTTAGLASYLLKRHDQAAERGVLVAYDGRTDSQRFAQEAACVLSAFGLTVYLTERVTPTPVAAFGVKHLGNVAAVVVTASHNPREYNGYKVYWENGAQIIPPHDSGICSEIDKAAAGDVPWMAFDEAVQNGYIVLLREDFYQAYFQAITGSAMLGDFSGNLSNISIAYTAMHGVGADMVESILTGTGLDRVYSVASQRQPDGSFPTVTFPNPEEPGAMDAVIALARETGATLACANDPDADRLAIAVRVGSGGYKMLSGDQVGLLLGNYALTKQHAHIPIVGSTIVSSSILQKVVQAAGAVFYETLTGFKWLANIALSNEDEKHRFVFAYEEALGYAFGPQVMDKDGLSALLAFAQMTSELTAKGMSVMDELERLYRAFGLHLTQQVSLTLKPGAPSVAKLLRRSPPESLAGHTITAIDDLKTGVRRHADGRCYHIDMPAGDVLIYRLKNGARVIIRPSGTEPKLKCYYETVSTIEDSDVFADIERRARQELEEMVAEHQSELSDLLG